MLKGRQHLNIIEPAVNCSYVQLNRDRKITDKEQVI